MTPQPTSSGHWTIYMDTPPPLTPVPRSPSQMSQVTVNGDFDGQQQPNGYPPNGFPPQQQPGPPPMGYGPPSNRNSQVIGHNGFPVPTSAAGFMGPNGPMMPVNGGPNYPSNGPPILQNGGGKMGPPPPHKVIYLYYFYIFFLFYIKLSYYYHFNALSVFFVNITLS